LPMNSRTCLGAWMLSPTATSVLRPLAGPLQLAC
jgi:hypothetical protein